MPAPYATPRPPARTPAAPTQPDTPCPACARPTRVRPDGRLHPHRRRGRRCPGSDTRPRPPAPPIVTTAPTGGYL